jgi:hypothetical protein
MLYHRRFVGTVTALGFVPVLWGHAPHRLDQRDPVFSARSELVVLQVRVEDRRGGARPVARVTLLLLPAYRVLMVWVYDRTGSLLVAMLMHGSLTATQLIFMPLPASRMSLLTSILAWAAALWIVVVMIAVASRWRISRPLLRGQVA